MKHSLLIYLVSLKESVGNMPPKVKVSPKAYTTYGMLSKHPWGEGMKRALLGSIDVETGGSFDYLQKQDKGGPGRGLFQFEGTQLSDYKDYLKDNNLQDSAENQIEFVYKSMIMKSSKAPHDLGWRSRGELQGMFNSKDTDAISDSLMKNYFRSGVPHLKRRKAQSKKYEKDL